MSIWTVGTTTTSTYHDSDAGPFRDEWSSTTANSADSNIYYHEGDVVTYLDGTRYTAKVDHPLSDPSNAAQWQAPTDALADQGGSIGSADQVASGSSDSAPAWVSGNPYLANATVSFTDSTGTHVYRARQDITSVSVNPRSNDTEWAQETGGYTSVLGGTTSSAPAPLWAAGAYDQGAQVTYAGHKYTAKNDIVNTSATPLANTAEWANADGQARTTSRLTSAMAGPQTRINSAASSVGGSVASGAISTVPTGGTTATIDGTVVAGSGHIHVYAKDNLTVFGIAGAAAGGFVGVGGSVLVLNVKSVTDAGVGPSASLSAGGAVSVLASMVEKSTPIGFAGGGGFVGVGAQVAVLNDTGTQNAHIDSSAQVLKAGGGLSVTVEANRDVHAYAVGVAAGAGAIGAAVAVVNVGGNASATIGNVAVGSGGNVNAVTVAAVDHVTSDTLVVSVAGGIGIGLGAAVAVIRLSGTLTASSGAHGSVGGGGFSVTADGTHTAAVTSVNVATGLGAVGVTVDSIENSRSTEAVVTGTGNIAFSTPAPAVVRATASNTVEATAPGGAFGGVGIAVIIATATLSGYTTTVVNGSISNATDITISAIADNSSTTTSYVFGVSVIGLSGSLASANIGSGADIETTVGSAASLGGSGNVVVEAKTRNGGNKAIATAKGGTGGVLFAGTLFIGVATTPPPSRRTSTGRSPVRRRWP